MISNDVVFVSDGLLYFIDSTAPGTCNNTAVVDHCGNPRLRAFKRMNPLVFAGSKHATMESPLPPEIIVIIMIVIIVITMIA